MDFALVLGDWTAITTPVPLQGLAFVYGGYNYSVAAAVAFNMIIQGLLQPMCRIVDSSHHSHVTSLCRSHITPETTLHVRTAPQTGQYVDVYEKELFYGTSDQQSSTTSIPSTRSVFDGYVAMQSNASLFLVLIQATCSPTAPPQQPTWTLSGVAVEAGYSTCTFNIAVDYNTIGMRWQRNVVCDVMIYHVLICGRVGLLPMRRSTATSARRAMCCASLATPTTN